MVSGRPLGGRSPPLARKARPPRKSPRALSDAPPTNRSSDEIEMRIAMQAWGRLRYPGCRVVHELVTQDRRIDVAFVTPTQLVGVEIKSEKDTLDRLWDQLESFQRYIPEVWVATAPKWVPQLGDLPRTVGRVTCVGRRLGAVVEPVPAAPPPREPSRATDPRFEPLHLLWRDELEVAAGRLLQHVPPRLSRRALIALIRADVQDPAHVLPQVCRELRARDAFWRADPPVYSGWYAVPGEAVATPAWSPRARQSLF